MREYLRSAILAGAITMGIGAEQVYAQTPQPPKKEKPTTPVIKGGKTWDESMAESDGMLTIADAQNKDKAKDKEPPFKLTYLGLELFGFPRQEITPEYAWKGLGGKLKGFGFNQTSHNPKSKVGNFTNHNIQFQPFEHIPVRAIAEGGFAGKDSFSSVGVNFDLKPIPTVDKVFDAATVAWLHKIHGVAPDQQVLLVWDTKPLEIGPLEIDGQGFYRIKAGKNYGQPQAWLKIKGVDNIKFGVQFEVAGNNMVTSFGLKFARTF